MLLYSFSYPAWRCKSKPMIWRELQRWIDSARGQECGFSHQSVWPFACQLRCPGACLTADGVPQLKHCYWCSCLPHKDMKDKSQGAAKVHKSATRTDVHTHRHQVECCESDSSKGFFALRLLRLLPQWELLASARGGATVFVPLQNLPSWGKAKQLCLFGADTANLCKFSIRFWTKDSSRASPFAISWFTREISWRLPAGRWGAIGGLSKMDFFMFILVQ